MALMTSLKETARFWGGDDWAESFLAALVARQGREEGGGMKAYWKGSGSRLGGRDGSG